MLEMSAKKAIHHSSSMAHALLICQQKAVWYVGVEVLVICPGSAVGADGTARKMAHAKAQDLGLPIPLENIIMSGSHSHSGPGAIAPEFLWEFAPATDLIVPGQQIPSVVIVLDGC